jgi:hypothetical protein
LKQAKALLARIRSISSSECIVLITMLRTIFKVNYDYEAFRFAQLIIVDGKTGAVKQYYLSIFSQY